MMNGFPKKYHPEEESDLPSPESDRANDEQGDESSGDLTS